MRKLQKLQQNSIAPQETVKDTGTLTYGSPELTDLESVLDSDKDASNSRDFESATVLANARRAIHPVQRIQASDFEDKDRVICAISESRSSDVIGLATINITTGQVEITRILNNDKYTYQQLGDLLWRMSTNPERFLVVESVTNSSSKSLLIPCLNQEYPDIPVVPYARQHWSEAEGLNMVDRFAFHGEINALRANLDNNFYASCAFAAVRFP